MAYTKQTWENLPSTNTPLTAERLNHMEDGIAEAWEHGEGGAGETLPVGSEIDFDGQTEDIPEGWEQVNEKMTILWTNPEPTQSISTETNISLSSDDYDMLEIVYLLYTNNNYYNSVKVLKGGSARLVVHASGSFNYRNITYNTDTSYTIGTNSSSGGNAVPVYIIGYKTELF